MTNDPSAVPWTPQFSPSATAVGLLAAAGLLLNPWQTEVLETWFSSERPATSEPEPVDALEAEVREQVAAGEPRTGHDYGNPTFPKCPHSWCAEHWHGLAITRRMWEMRQNERIDPEYRYTTDDSEVLCPGSLFEGEFTPPALPECRVYVCGGLVIAAETRGFTPTLTGTLREALASLDLGDDVELRRIREWRSRPMHEVMRDILEDADLTWTARRFLAPPPGFLPKWMAPGWRPQLALMAGSSPSA
ncbi:hypothetical protein [Nocardia sp. NPDC049149]|uniref:hypothetical protein n=1 Tax=Nocardia sp. NPDC049149 TaxID=3364315 RepID=UPI00371C3199